MGAQLRVVRRRIRSVQSTKKITRAMELIASSRIVKAQQRVEASRPYAIQLTAAMEDLARQTRRAGAPAARGARARRRRSACSCVTSDRGLAGAYNANVMKIGEEHPGGRAARGLEPVVYVIGKKGVGLLPVPGRADPASWQGSARCRRTRARVEIGDTLIEDFAEETIDELYCAYTDFRSAFTLRATVEAVPADRARGGHGRGEAAPAEYLFEPERRGRSSDHLLPQYLITKVYAALLESAARRTPRGGGP